ncbi:MAG TPA: hypothetical protein TECP_00548 [Hyphomicrobiaceae bacterium MAG_BT-2024]
MASKTYRLYFFLLLLIYNCTINFTAAASQEVSKNKDLTTLKGVQQLLSSGYASLNAQAPEDAIMAFSRALNSGELSIDQTARMLFYRAKAFLLLKQPADAISDLNSALWLKDALPKTYREKAFKARDAAYSALGIDSSGIYSSKATSRLKESDMARQSSIWKVRIVDKVENQVKDSDNVYPPLPSSIKIKKLLASPSKVASTSWSQNTQTSFNLNVVSSKSVQVSGAKKVYVVQIASLRSKIMALILARRVARDYVSLLQGLVPEVELQPIGNMGEFYHVRIKYWPNKESSKKLCKKILESGLDCFVKG